jgi:predicted transcriptional regulator YdeE
MVDSYIVRIYRYERDNPDMLVGLVEEVGIDRQRRFTNIEELWRILNSARKSERLGGNKATGHKARPEDKGDTKAF